MSNITRYRADTYPIRVTLRDSDGKLLNLSGSSFLFTVNSEAAPSDASSQIFQSIGSIVIPVTDGVVEFPVAGTTDAGEYFFDIEMTDSSGKTRTVEKGAYVLLQDVTKSDASGVIEFSGETPGTEIAMDGSGVFWPSIQNAADTFTYETRGASVVVRANYAATKVNVLTVGGTTAPFSQVPLGNGFRLKSKIYFDPGNTSDYIILEIRVVRPGDFQPLLQISFAGDYRLIATRWIEDGVMIQAWDQVVEAHAADWYWVGIQLLSDGSVLGDVWVDGEDEPDPWTMTTTTIPVPPISPVHVMYQVNSSVFPQESIFELERIEWELI